MLVKFIGLLLVMFEMFVSFSSNGIQLEQPLAWVQDFSVVGSS